MKKALIIGAGGFVGRYLAEYINEKMQWDVIVTKLSNEKLELPFATIWDLDILEMADVEKLLRSVWPDYIFHLAAQSSVRVSWEKPQMTVDINIKGSLNLLEAVRRLNYKPKVLLIGSSEEYGKISNEQNPVKEETKANPGNLYAVTKVCQNMIGQIYSAAYNMDITMVRAFNHIGPGQKEDFVISDFCKQVAEIELGRRAPVIYVGNLEAKRDFTDVRDVVRAYVRLAGMGKSGTTYNVGSGKAISIKSILERILLLANRNDIEIKIDYRKFRPVDISRIEADVKTIRKDTNWEAEIDIDDTISATLEYWRNHIAEEKI